MDYLDINKERRHNILLMAGYLLIGTAITIATLVLLYQAYGFGINRNGTVVQNGLIFFSSRPNPASIYTNGKLQDKTTNTRMTLPAGMYDVKLAREGYHDWQRKIEVTGGGVQHFDYPFLVPQKLDANELDSFDAAPGMITQSPDKRWLLVQHSASLTDLKIYDLKDEQRKTAGVKLPENLLSNGTTESWEALEWADDNKHVLLQHNYDDKREFILVDRTQPTASVNLNRSLSINPTKLELNNRKYDRYYAYSAADSTLRSLRLEGSSEEEPIFQRVIAYKHYSDDTLLYVTDTGAPAGKVLVKLNSGAKTWNIRQFSAGSSYVVDLTKYSGDMYVAAGSAVDNKVYIYKDPVGQLDSGAKTPGPVQVLHVDGVNFLSFSSSAQFIAAQNGNHFGVYDIENKAGYNYVTGDPLDPPQTHANWMDGNRLMYVSNGRLVMFDYDVQNWQVLGSSLPEYKAAFGPDFENLYLISPAANGRFALTETSLLSSADR